MGHRAGREYSVGVGIGEQGGVVELQRGTACMHQERAAEGLVGGRPGGWVCMGVLQAWVFSTPKEAPGTATRGVAAAWPAAPLCSWPTPTATCVLPTHPPHPSAHAPAPGPPAGAWPRSRTTASGGSAWPRTPPTRTSRPRCCSSGWFWIWIRSQPPEVAPLGAQPGAPEKKNAAEGGLERPRAPRSAGCARWWPPACTRPLQLGRGAEACVYTTTACLLFFTFCSWLGQALVRSTPACQPQPCLADACVL